MRNRTPSNAGILTPADIETMMDDPNLTARQRDGLQRLLTEAIRAHNAQAQAGAERQQGAGHTYMHLGSPYNKTKEQVSELPNNAAHRTKTFPYGIENNKKY